MCQLKRGRKREPKERLRTKNPPLTNVCKLSLPHLSHQSKEDFHHILMRSAHSEDHQPQPCRRTVEQWEVPSNTTLYDLQQDKHNKKSFSNIRKYVSACARFFVVPPVALEWNTQFYISLLNYWTTCHACWGMSMQYPRQVCYHCSIVSAITENFFENCVKSSWERERGWGGGGYHPEVVLHFAVHTQTGSHSV